MREHPENLKRGQWIMITGSRDEDAPVDSGVPFGIDYWMTASSQKTHSRHPLEIRPGKIMAVDYPFLCVCISRDGDRDNVTIIDLRDWFVKIVSADFVRSAIGVQPRRKKRQKPTKDDIDICPRCHSKMVQMWCGVDQPWIYVCKTCGFNTDSGSYPGFYK